MTTKIAGGIAASAVAVGILVGAAGAVLVHQAAESPMGMGIGHMSTGFGSSIMGGADPSHIITMHAAHHRGDR